MEFKLTTEQLALQKMAREFAEKKIIPIAAECDEKDEAPVELLKEMSMEGFNILPVPEEYGGPGFDGVTATIILEELARGCAGITTGAAANTLGAYPILIGGSDEQKKKFLPPLSQGKFTCFCLTEPESGSDAASTRTTAEKNGDEYIINGNKCFITNGGIADYCVVFATVDRNRGARGITAFVVERDTPGLSIGKKERKMGIRGSNTTEVIFEDVHVPAENLLGKEGDGFKIAMVTLDCARPMIGALAIGVARAAYETALKYAKEREQFGQSLTRFQAIQFKLVDMAIQIEAARLLIRQAAYLADSGAKRFSTEAAMAKCFAADTAVKVTVEAVQILGGYGYMKDYPTEKYMRDAKIMQIYEGTNEIQRIVIGNGIIRGR